MRDAHIDEYPDDWSYWLRDAAGRVSFGAVVLSDKAVTVNGPFIPGPFNLTVTWADGIQMLTYTVVAPD